MSNYLLGFPNKKERDDFLIAIVVILLFIWLFWYMLMGREKPNLNIVPPVAEIIEEPDADNDGILDIDDRCPNLAGVKENKGCPSDADNDGVYDVDDNCPKIPGISANNGCPSDIDGDGVWDRDDKCPKVKGKAATNGCPPLTQQDLTFLDDLRESVQFESNKADLKPESIADMNRLAEILLVKTDIKLNIEGHTDANGSNHEVLSQQRADACRNYLIQRGVSGDRLKAIGFGKSKPIKGLHGTDARNRRVVFKPVK